MLDYFITFTTKGIILFEKGDPPNFRDKFISTLNTNCLEGKENVRGINIFYKLFGNKVYLLFSEHFHGEKILKEEINNFEKPVEKDVIKDNLDYSESVVYEQSTLEIKPSFILKKFNLFKNEILVTELKERMKTHLINKNVAPEVADSFCTAIVSDLEGKVFVKEREFKHKLETTLLKLMKSVKHDELLEKIKEKKKNKQIFTFCFVGLNGVGKSTSLAKICCWLIQNNLKVFIAACDTFRAGAIEQLKVHVERFKVTKHSVGFYDKGYGEHETLVCKEAINVAKKEDYDVVLIDTAGRMHTNPELMQRLKKLIKINAPDHVIFVGEALVGSESLDHLNEFNKVVGNRSIDSLFITKVDTVDDKIGQLVNMSMAAAAPILFLGVGQNNLDLMKIDPVCIANLLMN